MHLGYITYFIPFPLVANKIRTLSLSELILASLLLLVLSSGGSLLQPGSRSRLRSWAGLLNTVEVTH